MLAANFPNDYYSQDFAKSGDFVGYFNNLAQREDAQRRSQINEQSFLEDMFRRREQQPLDMEAKRLGLELNRARLENEGLQKIFTTERTKALGKKPKLSPEEQDAKLAEFKARLSKAQAVEAESELKRRLLDPNITGEDRKKLEWARSQLTPFVQQAQKTEDKLALAQFQVDNRPPPRPVVARTAGAGRAPAAGKAPGDDLKLATQFEYMAASEPDPAKQAQLKALADAARQRHFQLIQAKEDAKKAGTVDLSGSGIAVRPPITAPTQTAPKPAATAAQPIYIKNPQTGARMVSDDGGKTWKPVK